MNYSATTRCSCGSGLRALRCCALDQASLGPPEASRHLLPLVDEAIALHARNDLAQAEKRCLEVLELAPSQGGALAVLYQIRKAQGVITAAEMLVRRLVTFNPNNVWATHELTLALFARRKLADAEVHARNAVRIAPTDPQSHNLMGMVLTEANRPQVGEYHYRRALELTNERPPILLANLAWNLRNQGKIAEARALYEESVALDSTILQTWLGWARMEESDREFARAHALLDEAQRLAPGNPSVLLHRAILLARTKEYDAALSMLERLERESGGLGTEEWLEKGRLLDKMGRFDEAFAAFAEGKRMHLEQGGQAYLDDHANDLTERLKRYFTAGRLRIVPRAAPVRSGPRPVFILGFPRSGTTMAEQILSAHPKISAGDELPFINELTELMPRMLNSPLAYPEALADLWMGDQREGLDNLRDYYLQRVRQRRLAETDAVWFTDKMPLNETHLGLIALLFPDAPVIYMLRHPLDVVLSLFSNHLTHGFYCANALETAARHYVRIAELVEHYRTEMALKVMTVRYEDVIHDQESNVKRMLDFVGVEFDQRCLNFHENRRYARTASYAQVTEKLYSRSRFRYRHYLKHLAPVIPVLEPMIERLGYTIDE
ncbi:tetratricopeptide repeat-containing sulfotransferase family protein [Paraburkholderia sp. SOS3]|uniref:tetratricopeptide repeat-containing sulfotransferase family protein n=1 Tax=Paraburkholderia sp. SOS3 TaxID=1926494 RepID=UPI0009474AB3|nr:tetratricopeptide repeat-containing sulfotransferase family protein [Paraburkholderia sp. SOS3]APR34915.1 pilus assembly protein [Paraburkholderia sp. SOS3]